MGEKLGHAANWTEQMKDEIKEAGSKLTDGRTYNKFVEKMARLHTRARKFWENADPRDPLSKTGKAVETVKEYGRKVKKYGRKVKRSFWSGMGDLCAQPSVCMWIFCGWVDTSRRGLFFLHFTC